MFVYFPSCKFTRACPETSKVIQRALRERYGMETDGCCRPGHKALAPGDTAVTVCHTCAAIIRENVPEAAQQNLVEFLAEEPDFPFPDLHGEEIALQDCWRVREQPALHRAARTVLEKMNARVVELPENRESASFCGTFRYSPLLPGNLDLAPRYFQRVQAQLELLPAEEQQRRLEEYCAALPANRTACYCNSCLTGLRQGGTRSVHLLELAFGTK